MNIPKHLYDQMINHGHTQLPYEACGLLAGNDQNDVLSVWPLENENESRVRYYVSKKVVNKTLNQISSRGQKVLAIYHSHPVAAPYPSSTDIHHHPDKNVKMIIISYKKILPQVRCFTINAPTYEQYPFSIITS